MYELFSFLIILFISLIVSAKHIWNQTQEVNTIYVTASVNLMLFVTLLPGYVYKIFGVWQPVF